jgi:hypothetical protein
VGRGERAHNPKPVAARRCLHGVPCALNLSPHSEGASVPENCVEHLKLWEKGHRVPVVNTHGPH